MSEISIVVSIAVLSIVPSMSLSTLGLPLSAHLSVSRDHRRETSLSALGPQCVHAIDGYLEPRDIVRWSASSLTYYLIRTCVAYRHGGVSAPSASASSKGKGKVTKNATVKASSKPTAAPVTLVARRFHPYVGPSLPPNAYCNPSWAPSAYWRSRPTALHRGTGPTSIRLNTSAPRLNTLLPLTPKVCPRPKRRPQQADPAAVESECVDPRPKRRLK